MKFVIWGRGQLGKLLLDLLGHDQVTAFIDSNKELQQTSYQGIPVIDYNTYKKQFVNVPIIVSPKNSTEKIFDLLQKDGIWWAFPFYDSMYMLMGFLRQAPLDIITKDYNQEQTLCIYGLNLLGLIMYDHFRKKGHNCRIILQNGIDGEIASGVDTQLGIQSGFIEQVKAKDRLLLAMPINISDADVLQEGVITEKYYNLGFRKGLYYYPALEKFKNKHAGQQCFIVATGPSLEIKDLDTLYTNHAICIGVNGISKSFSHTLWRPDYYVISDPSGTLYWQDDILKMDQTEKFVADVAWRFGNNSPRNTYRWHLQFEWADGVEPDFSDDFSRLSYWGCTIVYDGALQLAAYMGFKEIYLLGTDCTQPAGEMRHFVKDYSPDPGHLNIDNITLSYHAAKRYADSHGIKIYNATRGGALEVFERVDFDSLFKK